MRSEQTLEVYFSSRETPLARANDEVVLVVYSPQRGIAARNTHICKRIEGYIKVNLPPQLWTVFSTSMYSYTAPAKNNTARVCTSASWKRRKKGKILFVLPADQRVAAVDLQFFVDVLDMIFHRFQRNIKPDCHFFVGQALLNGRHYLCLTWG